MKTKEELNVLKEEVETMSKKLNELTDEELVQVTGGTFAECLACPHYGDFITCLKGFNGGRCPKFAELTDAERAQVTTGDKFNLELYNHEDHPISLQPSPHVG